MMTICCFRQNVNFSLSLFTKLVILNDTNNAQMLDPTFLDCRNCGELLTAPARSHLKFCRFSRLVQFIVAPTVKLSVWKKDWFDDYLISTLLLHRQGWKATIWVIMWLDSYSEKFWQKSAPQLFFFTQLCMNLHVAECRGRFQNTFTISAFWKEQVSQWGF